MHTGQDRTRRFSHIGYVCFLKSGFREITFQTFLYLFTIKKVGQRKILSGQRKFWLGFQKVFSFYFGRKTLSGSCEKFRNIILFADYIKFGPQTFDCYIYFVLNIYFSILSLRI
jgi:hypothetical protein